MTNPRDNQYLRRAGGFTYCAAGTEDLQPENIIVQNIFVGILEEFDDAACRDQPADLPDWPAWTPAYMPCTPTDNVLQADLLVMDLPGWQLKDVQKKVRRMDISSMMYETEYSMCSKSYAPPGMLYAPEVRLALILDHAVDADTYADLWSSLASKLFDLDVTHYQQDFNTRFRMPRLKGGEHCIRFTDGSPIAVDAVLRLREVNERNVAWVSKAPVENFWKPGSPVADY
jgi:hypothetical protein